MCLTSHLGIGQDLFSYKNSLKYANYLLSSSQFSKAEEEYKRVIFLNPSDTLAHKNLVRTAFHQQSFNRTLGYMDDFEDRFGVDQAITQMRMLVFLGIGNTEGVRSYLNQGMLDESQHDFLSESILATEGKWAELTMNVNSQSEIVQLANAYVGEKRKSPVLAGMLSGLIPGLGKVYSKRAKDGLFSLLMTVSAGWQSYRGFSKNGVRSAVGWGFGVMATAFYAGNVYGGVKSARVFNDQIDEEYNEKLRAHIAAVYADL
ncbi:MAG: hypothetical protein JXQ90_02135 [Cyclobacteriaceae bacterium]